MYNGIVRLFRIIEVSPMGKIEFVLGDERIIPTAGIAAVGAILGNAGFTNHFNKTDVTTKRSQRQIRNGDIFTTGIAIQCMGKPDFDTVRELHEDPEFYQLALGIESRIPSEESLRMRMDAIGNAYRERLLNANIRILAKNGIHPSMLACGMVPVDLDVSPHDNSKTHKQGVSRTYKGCDGYAPMYAYIGAEGYMANAELRPGSQHCQNHTPEFLRETIDLCRKITDESLLFRMDSGNVAAENEGILLENGCFFIIKRNLRKESPHSWLEHVKPVCRNISHPREGKDVYIGSTWKEITYTDSDGISRSDTIRIVYEIIERSIDKHGQYLLPHDVEVNMFWTNLSLSDEEVIGLYHAHGESEQYHSELKHDMDLERFPSGKFETNELFLELAIISYNILRMIGQEVGGAGDVPMKRRAKRRRLRTVILNIIYAPAHVTTHARQVFASLGRSNVWAKTFLRVNSSFQCCFN